MISEKLVNYFNNFEQKDIACWYFSLRKSYSNFRIVMVNLIISGVKVIFRVALVLIRLCLGSQESLKSSPGLYETLEKLRHIPSDIDESFIVREVRYHVLPKMLTQ